MSIYQDLCEIATEDRILFKKEETTLSYSFLPSRI